MKKLRKFWVLALLAVAIPASAQVLYKVEGNGLKEPSYLFGTHHIAPLSVIDKFGAKTPFKSAEQVVGEIDMTQDPMSLAMAMQPHMMAPVDSMLSKVIPADVYEKVNEEFKKYAPMPGMDLRMLEPMKPNSVSTMITVALTQQAMLGYNPEEQLDTWFQAEAKKSGKKIVPLETAEEQAIILFDMTPIADQAQDLIDMLTNTEGAVAKTKELNEAYLAQDIDKLLKLSEEENSRPEFMKALLDQRNANWLLKLPAIFSNGTTFVAVGALHLPGEQGIVQGLRNLGYTVTPIRK